MSMDLFPAKEHFSLSAEKGYGQEERAERRRSGVPTCGNPYLETTLTGLGRIASKTEGAYQQLRSTIGAKQDCNDPFTEFLRYSAREILVIPLDIRHYVLCRAALSHQQR